MGIGSSEGRDLVRREHREPTRTDKYTTPKSTQGTKKGSISMQSWVHVLEHSARVVPDVVAVQDASGRSLRYDELLERVERIAGGWEAAGVQHGERVVVLLRNSAEYLVQVLALARAGAIPTLVNWRLSTSEVGELSGLFEPTATVFDPEFASLADATQTAVAFSTDADAENSTTQLDAEPPSRPVDRLLGDQVFAILHTSGTTGLPKGVPLTNRGSTAGIAASSAELPQCPAGARHFRIMPMFHLAGLGGSLIALLRGDTLLLHERFDPADFLDTIERHGVAFSNAGPSLLRRICDEQERRPRDLSSLQELWYGTEAIPGDLLARAMNLLDCRFRQNYGMTEAQRPVSQLVPADHQPDDPHLDSAGRPLAGWEVRIVRDDGADAAEGEAGEIWIRSESMFPGYWGNEAATAAAFVGPTDRPGRAWYRTGDVGSLTDGYLRVLDRIDDMIITGGENVHPAEIENVLREHPAVADVAVVGRASDRWGQSVHAAIVTESEVTFDPDDLVSWARDRLAHFKCPRSISLLDELPRNATGKVLRRVVRTAVANAEPGSPTTPSEPATLD